VSSTLSISSCTISADAAGQMMMMMMVVADDTEAAVRKFGGGIETASCDQHEEREKVERKQ
jgi:hypothetical protein